jgi:2-iminobutanoate/2-iminopropanoate deaminase
MSTDRTPISTSDAYAPSGSYSQAIVAGDVVYVSGQAAFDAKTGETVGRDVATQTNATIDNLEAVLAAAGCTLADVVKVTAHLAAFELFDDYDRVYRERFPEPRPARTTVASGLGGVFVELDCIAVRPS